MEPVLALIWTYGMATFNWIIKESKIPWLKLDIKFPYESMLKEAKKLKRNLVKESPCNTKLVKCWH